MISVLHVFDAACDPTVLQVAETLRTRLADGRARHSYCAIDAFVLPDCARFIGAEVQRADRRVSRLLNWSPRLSDIAAGCGADVIHAWGVDAARVAMARLRGKPLVLSLLDPGATADAARWIRSFPRTAIVATGNQVTRSRLLAAGLDASQTVVIRGPVDFRAITESRDAGARETLLGDDGPVALLAGSPSRAGGQFFGTWAAAIVAQVLPRLRIVMPYESREARKLRRFVDSIGMPRMLVEPPPDWTWPRLVATADVLLAPAIDEIGTEPLGWAMAASVPVVGSAIRSITELIADNSNGLLCKARRPKDLAARLLTILEDEPLRRRLGEVARGQAYEVFGMRNFADNFAHLYDNVLAGRTPSEEIQDTAMVS